MLGKVTAICQVNKPPHLWNMNELKIMVTWYKREGDAALPTKKDLLIVRYEEAKEHSECSLPVPPAAAKNDGGDSSSEEDNDTEAM